MDTEQHIVNARQAYEIAGSFVTGATLIVGDDARTNQRIVVYASNNDPYEPRTGLTIFRSSIRLSLFQWADTHTLFAMDQSYAMYDMNTPLEGDGLSWDKAIDSILEDSKQYTDDDRVLIRSKFHDLWQQQWDKAALFLVHVADSVYMDDLITNIHGAVCSCHENVADIVYKTANIIESMDVIEAATVFQYGHLKMTDLSLSSVQRWTAWTSDLNDAEMPWTAWLPYMRLVGLINGRPNSAIASLVSNHLSGGSADWATSLRVDQRAGSEEMIEELHWWCCERPWQDDDETSRSIAIECLSVYLNMMIEANMKNWPSISQQELSDVDVSYRKQLMIIASSSIEDIRRIVASAGTDLRDVPSSGQASYDDFMNADIDVTIRKSYDIRPMIQALSYTHTRLNDIFWRAEDANQDETDAEK
jgi:hypothetical protein